ncbi:hypothetical protein [uncultured Draconibacterium sp.]|uniref:hypothetical protein n=1 Tax=uncultured Draconibacterium sp. TaxID=1573823 RepID=UPI002AA6E47C|nr:hypothetical protein [uncultured Draconibacterium sp.]
MKIIVLLILVMIFCGCSKSNFPANNNIQRENISRESVVNSSASIPNDEFITAEGSSIVLNKYPEKERNILLARRGAILDAQRNLAEKIIGLKMSSATTSKDFEVTEVVKSQIKAQLSNFEIVSEYNNLDESKYYNVVIRMRMNDALELVRALR